MIPSATNILRLRFVARVALRLGLLYFLYRAAGAAYDAAHSIIQFYVHPTSFSLQWFLILRPIPEYLFLAALLFAADRWLLRWLVPASVRRCPACEHHADRLAARACTECGALLPREWVERPAGEAR